MVSINKALDIRELDITVTAKELNPAMQNLDFLKFSGIIPADWELARQPMMSPQMVQFSFKSGVNIVAQPGSITFAERIDNQSDQGVSVPELTQRYVEKLPNAEYQRLTIGTKNLIGLDGEVNAARQYMLETLVAPGPWRELGAPPPQVSITFNYQLQECPLTLAISEVRLQSEQQTLSGLLFAGSFIYGVAGNADQDSLQQLQQRIGNWQANFHTFLEIVNQRFVDSADADSVFPANAVESAILSSGTL